MIVNALEKFLPADFQYSGPFYEDASNLRMYPALLLYYVFGITTLANRNYDLLAKVILSAKAKSPFQRQDLPFSLVVFINEVIGQRLGRMLPGKERNRTPGSDYIYETLMPLLTESLIDSNQFEKYFDHFEYLNALIYVDLYDKREVSQERIRGWGPLGRFAWKSIERGSINFEVIQEAETMAAEWPPLKAGLFSGSLERRVIVQKAFNEFFVQVRNGWGLF